MCQTVSTTAAATHMPLQPVSPGACCFLLVASKPWGSMPGHQQLHIMSCQLNPRATALPYPHNADRNEAYRHCPGPRERRCMPAALSQQEVESYTAAGPMLCRAALFQQQQPRPQLLHTLQQLLPRQQLLLKPCVLLLFRAGPAPADLQAQTHNEWRPHTEPRVSGG